MTVDGGMFLSEEQYPRQLHSGGGGVGFILHTILEAPLFIFIHIYICVFIYICIYKVLYISFSYTPSGND